MRRKRKFLVGAAATAMALTARSWAHGREVARGGAEWWRDWTWEPGVVSTLFVVAALYVSGRRRLGPASRGAVFFWTGWAMLVVALVSPMHPWGQVFFSVHMVQHEVLMVVAAPLLVLGRPLRVMLRALPPSVARGGLAEVRRCGGGGIWRAVENPFAAWLIHAVALWIWHVPALFEATLTSEAVHALQHACFLGTALVFWQAVIYGPRRRFGYGMSVVYLFTTAVHSGALGALLTFAARAWYPAYATNGGVGGLSALEDQQLGGLIMWIPAGVIYAGAALGLFASWMHARREPGVAGGVETRRMPCVPSSGS